MKQDSGPAVRNLFGTRDRFHRRQFFHGRGGGGLVQAVMQAMGSDGEQWGAVGSSTWSFAHSPTTQPPAVRPRFLTGCRLVPVRGPGVGDPCSGQLAVWSKNILWLSLIYMIKSFFHTAPSPWPLTSPPLPKQPTSVVVPQREDCQKIIIFKRLVSAILDCLFLWRLYVMTCNLYL